LFGKRKFGIYVLLGIFFSYVASHVSALDLMDWEMAGIGFIIPGLIGLDMERQGIVRTLVSMGIVLGILYLYVWLVIS
ncbi:MAG: poly-gamma-glutamate biosynthesis protein PgsC, partial [Proteobacteria bacterium]|nr:poly-gamma-glutamate biosynthesis protein PgsC [Pseudomonadota bacterium]